MNKIKYLKVTSLVRKHLERLRIQLKSIKMIHPASDHAQGHNLGVDRAIDLVDVYLTGKAFMQEIQEEETK